MARSTQTFCFNSSAYAKSPGNISSFAFDCLAAIVQSHYKKSIKYIKEYYRDTGVVTYSKDTGRNSPRERAAKEGKEGENAAGVGSS